jgi:hypothetical protein
MITPAVLISACGTLIMSTSNRLTRAADRMRNLADRTRELAHAPAGSPPDAFAEAERKLILAQLPKLMRRVYLIHRGLAAFYLAVGLFVLSSLLIGSSRLGLGAENVAVGFGLAGVLVLFIGAALLTVEAQLSLEVNQKEMEFIRDFAAK